MSAQRETWSRAFFYALLLAISGYSFGGAANPTCSVSCAYRSELAHSIAYWGTWAANIGTAIFVLIYWLYTLKEKSALQFWLRKPRALWFGLPMGIFPLISFWLYEGLWGTISMIAFLFFDLYAYRRQWVDGHPAILAKETHNYELLSDEAPIVVTEDGRALSLAELEKNKLMVVPGSPRLLFVHCRLSRSLNTFLLPENTALRASLPHQTGFIIQCNRTKNEWDGVDGRALGNHADLASASLHMTTQSEATKGATIKLFLADPKDANRRISPCSPQLPSAQSIDNAMDLGVVEKGQWNLNAENADEKSYYIARWAAHHRGVGIPPELI